VIRTGGGDPIASPDGRFSAWIGVEKQFHLYFEDRVTNTVYEILNRRLDGRYYLAWKGNHILVFDQINGYGPVRNDEHGVHYEIDVEKKEVVWAVPFGPLSFPQRVE